MPEYDQEGDGSPMVMIGDPPEPERAAVLSDRARRAVQLKMKISAAEASESFRGEIGREHVYMRSLDVNFQTDDASKLQDQLPRIGERN